MSWGRLLRDVEAVMARAGFDLRSADSAEKTFGNWVMLFERPEDGVQVRFVNDRGQVIAEGSEAASRLDSALELIAPSAFLARLESHLDLLRESA